LPDARDHADVARDRAGAIKVGWIPELRDQTSRGQRTHAFDSHQQFAHPVIVEFAFDVPRQVLLSTLLSPERFGL